MTNGRKQFVQGDGRTPWARRHRDVSALHIEDLGEPLSEAQLSLCRRAATIEVELEKLEGRLSEGEEVDLDVYGRLVGQLRRILESLGIRREAKTVVPDLRSYVVGARR